MKKELLAPAGDIEAGYAAIHYGANAVYMGLQQFSARATATNFDESALNEFTGYAHSKGCRVFAAVNTLVQEDELADLLKTLDICSRCHIDAVIIQDLGVAKIVREQYPELEMHASTQMAIHNREGALALKKMGFKRVVVARELSKSEIEEIAAIPGLETEAFIHGALCYSYSGLCLFSSMESGRSANRGKCLYPCRAVFGNQESGKHFFSMKDLALEESILEMPVTSLKIEGRKKNALYVAAVTDYYRSILDGKGAFSDKADHIKQIFSRPWCKFHFNGKDKTVVDSDFVGHRGLCIGKIEQIQHKRIVFRTNHPIARYDGIQIEVLGQDKPFGFSLQMFKVNGKPEYEAKKGDVVEIVLPGQTPPLKKGYGIYLASSGSVKRTYNYVKPKPGEFKQKSPLDVVVKIENDKIIAESQGIQCTITGNFAVAEVPERMADAVRKAFVKTGETDFELNDLVVQNPENCFVPISILNDLRRHLYSQVKVESKKGRLTALSVRSKKVKPQWIMKTDNLEILNEVDINEITEIIYLLDSNSDLESLKKYPKNKIRLALPAVCRKAKMQLFVEMVNGLTAQGYKKWEIGNYWGLEVLPDTGIDLSFDSSIYMMNSQAMEMAKISGASRITLSIEDTADNLKKNAFYSPVPVTMVVYQDVPLFTSAVCIRSNECKKCPQGERRFILTKNNQRYEALSKDCHIVLTGSQPLCLAQVAKEVEADYFRVDFLYKKYSSAQAKKIFETVSRFNDTEGSMKGNSFRDKVF